MTTTDTTTPVPAWLNLDAILPNEVTALHAEVYAELLDLAPRLIEAAANARTAMALLRHAEDAACAQMGDQARHDLADGLGTYLRTVSGQDRNWEMLSRLAELLDPDTLAMHSEEADAKFGAITQALGEALDA